MKRFDEALSKLYSSKEYEIPKKSKSELLRSFRAYFSYSTDNRFYEILNGKVEPTQIEEHWLEKTITESLRRSHGLIDLEAAKRRVMNLPLPKKNWQGRRNHKTALRA